MHPRAIFLVLRSHVCVLWGRRFDFYRGAAAPFSALLITARAFCGTLGCGEQLTAMFLHGTSAPQACWTIIGVGIRMAQDVGAHRKKVYSASPTIEEELWRRAFWCVPSSLLLSSRDSGWECRR